MLKKLFLFVVMIAGFVVQNACAQSLAANFTKTSDRLPDSVRVKFLKTPKNASPHAPNLRKHGDEHHHEGLHFAHPLFTESVSPDTKLRFDYNYRSLAGGVTNAALILGGEYAFNRSFSIEVGIPYEFLNPDIGTTRSRLSNMEVSFKFANYAYEESGLLLGYGLELGLPTGNNQSGIGSSNILELAPYLNAGLKKGAWEWIVFSTFGIPTNQDTGQEIETELELNASALYNLSERWQGLLELNGHSPLSGGGEEPAWFLSPGFKVAPLSNEHLKAGVGVQIPLSQNPDQELGLIGSVFYHFH